MKDQNMPKILSHLNQPKRIFGFTVDETLISGIGAILLAVCNQKAIILLCFASILWGLRKLKKNRGPRYLIVLFYWCLPHKLTRYLLPKLPDSAIKFWKN